MKKILVILITLISNFVMSQTEIDITVTKYGTCDYTLEGTFLEVQPAPYVEDNEMQLVSTEIVIMGLNDITQYLHKFTIPDFPWVENIFFANGEICLYVWVPSLPQQEPECHSFWILGNTTHSIETHCSTANVESITIEKKLLKVVDIMGNETYINNNKVLFYIYEDGTIEKRFNYENIK